MSVCIPNLLFHQVLPFNCIARYVNGAILVSLMKHDISISARATKWFMLCDVPGLPGTHTCSTHVCSSSNCRRDQHIASIPPSPVLTDVKGAAWARYQGNRCLAIGGGCGGFLVQNSSLNLNTVTILECSLFSYLFSQKPPPPHSVAWPHYPAKVVLSFKIAVNHRLHATVAYLRTWSVGLLHSWSYVLCFPACCVAAKCTVSALHLVLIRIIR